MSLVPVALVLLLLLLIAAAGLVAVLLLRALRSGGVRWSQIDDPVARRWRDQTTTAWRAGIVVAGLTVVLIVTLDDLGRGLVLAPVGLVVLLLGAALALRVAVDRPRSGPGARERYLDDLIRRTSAQRVVGVVSLASFGTTFLVVAMALIGLSGGGDTEVHPAFGIDFLTLGWVLLSVLCFAGLGVVLALCHVFAPQLPTGALPAQEVVRP